MGGIVSSGENLSMADNRAKECEAFDVSRAATAELFVRFHEVFLRQTERLIGLDKGLDLERLMLRDGPLICGHSWPSSY